MYHNFIVLSIYTTIMSGNLKLKRCAYEEMYDDMLTTDQMIQMLEEEDSDKEFLGFD